MKKVFALQAPGKNADRVIEAVKFDVRKYVKRERRKTVPEGFAEWEFDCRAGATAAVATTVALKEISTRIDAVAAAGGTEIYIEILARAAHRAPRDAAPAAIVAPASPTTPIAPVPEAPADLPTHLL